MHKGSTLSVKEALNTTELVTKEKALELIEILDANNEVDKLNFAGIELINTAFLSVLSNYIVNIRSNKVVLLRFKSNQRELVREAFINARRISK